MRVVLLTAVVLAFVCGRAAAEPRVAARPSPTHQSAIDAYMKTELDGLLALYRQLHASPELSLQEEKTAAVMAEQLRARGYDVHTGVGGHGVVALLDNGPGPTLMIRGDMDGLPVVEQTKLPFRSQVEATGAGGEKVGVMHACGHDVHMTSLLGTAGVLAANRDAWSGKLMIVAQPAEELGEGARRMMQDGLFRRFGRPDYTLALHVEPSVESGKVAVVPGWAAANVDAVDITVHGRGGHGARPHVASDPIVASAELVMALQTLVSRRVDPQDPAVVTVGSIHGGTKYNVIPDSVHLQLTVRSYSDAVRSTLLDGIAQIARDVCSVHRCERPPDVKVKQDYTPAVYNDPELARAAVAVFEQALGQDAVVEIPPTMGGEDFGRFARELKVPGLLFRLGATPRAALVRSRAKGASPVPTLHSSRFAPDAKRAIPTGVRATASLALALLARPE